MTDNQREREPLLPMNNRRRHAKAQAASDGDARRPMLAKSCSPEPDRFKLSRRTTQVLAALGATALVLGAVVVTPSGGRLSPSLGTEQTLDDVDARDHMRAMHDACVMHSQAIIPWSVGLPRDSAEDDPEEDQETTDAKCVLYRQDPRVLAELRRCPDIDIFLPAEPRELGYCEDGSAFATYLESRLLPQWVLEDSFEDVEDPQRPAMTYHELCPHTPVLVFSHHWDEHQWPDSKPVYLMVSVAAPGLMPQHLWRSDVVLCRTESCRDRVAKWFKQQGNPRGSSVVLTGQTSLDATRDARRVLGEFETSDAQVVASRIAPKDFSDVIRFTHLPESSRNRGTVQVLECWLSRPDLPPLDVYIHDDLFAELGRDGIAERLEEVSNVNVSVGRLDPVMLGHILAESAFLLCPSTTESDGHYINQARAAGGVIVTTDAHPMNELIPSSDMGVLIKTRRRVDAETLLGGAYKGEHGLKLTGSSASDGLGADFGPQELCDAVDFVLDHTTVHERELMSTKAQRAYHEDTTFFARRMLELREQLASDETSRLRHS